MLECPKRGSPHSDVARSLAVFSVRRADIETFARDLEAGAAPAPPSPAACAPSPGFYKYAVEEELLEHSPAARVLRPRVGHESHAAALDRNEPGAILVAAGPGPPAGHALIFLLALSGLRVSGASGSARQVQDGVGVLGGPSQYADRLCRGQDDRVDLATAGLFLDLLHNGSTPSAPVPITSRRQCQGMSSAIESGVCPCASRNLLDAAFLRLRIFPRSMIRSWLYVTPSTRTEPNE